MATTSRSRFWAARISILAVLPLLILKLIFLSNIQGWTYALSYGFFFLGIAIDIIVLIAYLGVELFLRFKHLNGIQKFPWFTPIVAIGLLSFFFVGEWVKPVVIRTPQWCRVNQVIKWTSPNNESFVLVLVGRGNVAEHEFSSAYLNWSGHEPAGISTINFKPIRFRWWEGYNLIYADATHDELRKRLAPSGLPDDQIDSLTLSIWDVLQQANNGKTIYSPTAQVDPVWESPFDNEHIILGGVLWIILLMLLFLTIGQLTLTKPPQSYST